ncbi:MAG: cyclic nucleotide-binding domain-containing protein [Planctomycetes bacterium]|nr:cyclic nucleotide-binding domain-containing protein [Planctomycetota bacterium]
MCPVTGSDIHDSEEDSRGHCFSPEAIPRVVLNWVQYNSILSIAWDECESRGKSIESILQIDARVVEYEKADIIIRKGDYGGSVLIPLEGEIRVNLEESGEKNFARKRVTRKRSWLSALGQIFRRKTPVERINANSSTDKVYTAKAHVPRLEIDLEEYMSKNLTRRIGLGEICGEIAALRRSPRTASIFAESDCKLLEIRWQGVREILKNSKEFSHYLEDLIGDRRHQIFSGMKTLTDLPEAIQRTLSAKSIFERWGSDHWNRNFRKIMQSQSSMIDRESIILQQGHHMDGLYVLLSGFARVTSKEGSEEKTVGYLRPGDVYGLKELMKLSRTGVSSPALRSIRAVGAIDLVVIPSNDFVEYVLPELKNLDVDQLGSEKGLISTELLNFFLDRRIVNGNQTMVIDLNRCTDCDDCVKACAVTHDGNPRFIREGYRHAKLMVATACMHCIDPVCLVGCPTGAIHREHSTGNVVITQSECIGCASCVESCPYDNIRTVEVQDANGEAVIDLETGKPVLKATKCDLCIDQPSGPACVNACPHDALHRINFSDASGVSSIVERITG